VSFAERLRECRYVSPSGVEFSPLFDDVERSGGKKAPVHELPHRNVADVQDLGNTAEKYPLALYFTGPDYDKQADAFYDALHEKGRAKLKHPRWGDRDVLPLTWSQSEKLIERVWYAAFQIDFVEAPDPASLTISSTTAAAIQSAAEIAAAKASDASAAQISALVPMQALAAKGAAVDAAASAFDQLRSLTSGFDDVRSAMGAAHREIERNIDTLAAVPLDLTSAIIRLVRMPANLETSITEKLKGYASLLAQNCATLADLGLGAITARIPLILGGAAALAEATASGTLTSRSDAVDAYNALTDSAADTLAAVEAYVDDPDALAVVRQLCSDARARLLVESYSLPTERSMVLQGDSDPVTLAFQLYGDPERMDDIIEQNHLADEAILVIPRGTEIRWYE
jgi:prophage DNA circulation protein